MFEKNPEYTSSRKKKEIKNSKERPITLSGRLQYDYAVMHKCESLCSTRKEGLTSCRSMHPRGDAHFQHVKER